MTQRPERPGQEPDSFLSFDRGRGLRYGIGTGITMAAGFLTNGAIGEAMAFPGRLMVACGVMLVVAIVYAAILLVLDRRA